MLFKTLNTYGADYLPASVLFVIFVFLYGLVYANPLGFVAWMVLLSIYTLVFTSIYYIINGFLTIGLNL